jgi:hypothetical protein
MIYDKKLRHMRYLLIILAFSLAHISHSQEALTVDITPPLSSENCTGGLIDLSITGGFPLYEVTWYEVLVDGTEEEVQYQADISGDNDGEDLANVTEGTSFSMNKNVGLTPTSLIVNNGNGVADTLYNGRLVGLPAQGDQNDNPRSIFENHAIVIRQGFLYDPSYGGGPFTDFNDYYSSSLEGEGSRLRYDYEDANGQMQMTEIIWIESTY